MLVITMLRIMLTSVTLILLMMLVIILRMLTLLMKFMMLLLSVTLMDARPIPWAPTAHQSTFFIRSVTSILLPTVITHSYCYYSLSKTISFSYCYQIICPLLANPF